MPVVATKTGLSCDARDANSLKIYFRYSSHYWEKLTSFNNLWLPLLQALQNWYSIISSNNTWFFCHYSNYFFWVHELVFQITPDQVTGPCRPGPVFIIIDCPTLAFMPSLVSNKRLQQHWESQYWEEGPKKTPVVIVHLTPMEVFQSKEYEVWRKRW